LPFGFADPGVAGALQPMVDNLRRLIGSARDEVMAPPGLSVWARAQRTLQPVEAWQTFRTWVERDNPRFAFSVARGLVAASQIPASERSWATLMRQEARGRMAYLLPPGTILCLPTTPFPAPRKGLPLPVLDPLRDRITCLCAQGGLTGVPQVNLPGATIDGAPIGLSIIGGRGSDATLIGVAQAMEAGA
jgi:amidase